MRSRAQHSMQSDTRTDPARFPFRFKTGGAMAAIFVFACQFACWHALRPRLFAVAWLDLTVVFKTMPAPRLTPPVLDDSRSRLGATAPDALATGLRVFVPRAGAHVVQVRRETGDPMEDRLVVDAVVDALIAANPPGSVNLRSRARIGGTTVASSTRLLVSAAAGLAAWIALLAARLLAHTMPHWESRLHSPRLHPIGESP